MLRVSRLTKRFGEAVALDGVSFAVHEGEVVGLVGPNGSGKSTALRCILGLLNFDGDITIAGIDARRHGREARRRTGYVPQSPAFHSDLTAHETLVYYAKLRGLGEAEVERAAAAGGIERFAGGRVGALSGGMRQRLALAVALLGEPPLLLLDEPTASLDVDSRRRFAEMLLELKRQLRTVLVATHSLRRLEGVLSGVVALDEGKVVYQGPPAGLPPSVLDDPLPPGNGTGHLSPLELEATR